MRSHPGSDFIGERDELPDISALPGPMRRTISALLWLLDQEFPAGREQDDGGESIVTGNPASPGTVTGPARIVLGESDFAKVGPGDVIVSP